MSDSVAMHSQNDDSSITVALSKGDYKAFCRLAHEHGLKPEELAMQLVHKHLRQSLFMAGKEVRHLHKYGSGNNL